jgi:hypothetical protein
MSTSLNNQGTFYIQVDGAGNAISHPAFEENLLQAFPEQIPSDWEPFVFVNDPPYTGAFEYKESSYVKTDDGYWTIVYIKKLLEGDEKTQKQKEYEQRAAYVKGKEIEIASFAEKDLLEKNDENGSLLWSDYKQKMSNWSLDYIGETYANLFNPPMPRRPTQQQDGTWVAGE